MIATTAWTRPLLARHVERLRTLTEIDRLRALSAVRYYHPDLDDPRRAARMLEPMPGLAEFEHAVRTRAAPDREADYLLRDAYPYPTLSRAQERHLFRRIALCKHRVALSLDGAWPDCTVEAATLVMDRHTAAACNVRLVARAVARRRCADPADLFSVGQVRLVELVDKFNPFRGLRFITYAYGYLVREFQKHEARVTRRREARETLVADLDATPAGDRGDDDAGDAARNRVADLLLDLTPRERNVVAWRAGLAGPAMTYSEIAARIGCTKRRAQQVYEEALAKLRGAGAGLFGGLDVTGGVE